MALADPDLPPGIALPELDVDPPRGFAADRYRALRAVYYELPRRSRVIVVLRLPLWGRRPLTLRAIGELFGIGPERVRQVERHAVWMLVLAWQPQRSPGDLTRSEQNALLVPVLGAALDGNPLEGRSGRSG
ncbi:MAG TPA: sigma factor-like helix-turn-helix DNA-binding protein [Thermoleophilaceae bacterium]|nr:sigma factor-like helix-turn-helix DNA-binding protein [Thermoleophilaceae bacterium]